MVLFDNDFLSFLFYEEAGVVVHPKTRTIVERVGDRIDHLVATLAQRREKIIIPAPVLTEILCRADSRLPEILDILTSNTYFEIAAFDTIAAVEAALSLAKALKSGSKKQGASKGWPEIKFDRQIVAIAKTRQATAIYSNDAHVRKLAKESGIPAVAVWELPEPPAIQTEFPLES